MLHNIPSELRKEYVRRVAAFADAMLWQLIAKTVEKGGMNWQRPPTYNDQYEYLERIRELTHHLSEELEAGFSAERVGRLAAHIGNYAMMIADNTHVLDPGGSEAGARRWPLLALWDQAAEYVEDVESGTHHDDDDAQHYIFEDVVMWVYGPKVFEKRINPHL